VVFYRSLKTKENFKVLALIVVAGPYERCPLTRGSKYNYLTLKLLVVGKLVAEEKWLLTRGGHNQRFDCISIIFIINN